MIVDDAMFVLRAVDEVVRADLVSQTGGDAGKAEDFINRRLGKDVVRCTAITQMPGDIGAGLRSVVLRQLTPQIDTLADSRVRLQPVPVPQFALPDQ